MTLGLAILLVAIVLPLYAVKVAYKTDYTDFDVYYHAGERIRNGLWAEIYNLKDGASPFRYSPLFLPFFRALSAVPASVSKMVWYFLQFIWFGAGFYWIYRTVDAISRSSRFQRRFKNQTSPPALWITAISLLYVLRFCLDSFTIGQISSLMFLGFTFGLYGWTVGHPAKGALGIVLPTFLKIGPGFLIGLFLTFRARLRLTFLKSWMGISAAWLILASLWIGSLSRLRMLWSGWMEIVANDSVYYDAAHYGSQSLKSFLLRGVRQGWLSAEWMSPLYLLLFLLICGFVFLFWVGRKPASLYGRGLFYSLGSFVILWMMPETFKYSLTPLAIPIALLTLKPRLSLWDRFAWIFGVFTLSLAGKDFLPDEWFFGWQLQSIPLFATVFLGISVIQTAWNESVPSSVARLFKKLWPSSQHQLGPWEVPLENRQISRRKLAVSVLIPLPLTSDSAISVKVAISTLDQVYSWLESTVGPSFEMIVVPYGNRLLQRHPVLQKLKNHQDIKTWELLRFLSEPGASQMERGSALRSGFLVSQGEVIFFLHLESPCHTDFFERAYPLLIPAAAQGSESPPFHLVRGNRRLVESRFQLPVRVLPWIYQRHQLGLWFNRVIRWVLPIQTTDTHSGNLGMNWRLAAQAFALQTSENILFELELHLVSAARGYREKDLPVTLTVEEEKRRSRVIEESIEIAVGLPVLAWRYRQGYYNRIAPPQGITADDWGLSEGVNRGILELARQGIVKRVSMMANTANLQTGLKELCALSGLELGIHFNLTYGKPLQSESTQAEMLMQSPTRFISSPGRFLLNWCNPFNDRTPLQAHVTAELQAQLNKLRALGVEIEYLDGHHHIHIVPGIMAAIAPVLQQFGIKKVRLPYDPSHWLGRKAPLAFFAWMSGFQLKKFNLTSRPCIYPATSRFFDPGKLYAQLGRNPQAEVIVHPAQVNDLASLEFPDSYTAERVIEYRALSMLEFVI